MGNLSWQTSWQDLKDHFRQCGTVVHASVMEERPGRSKGCGIVEFESAAEAQQAIDTLTDTDLNGRNIWIREDREDRGPNRNSAAAMGGGGGGGAAGAVNHLAGRQLYVGNLSFETTWQDLKDHFNIDGCPVQRAETGQNPDGSSKGWGTIRYANPDQANAAIQGLNGSELDGRILQVRLDNQAL